LEKETNPLGILSAIGTFSLMAVIAAKANAFGIVITEVSMLFSGSFSEVARNHTTFLMMFPVILAVVVLELPCTIIAAILQAKILGKSSKHALEEFFRNMGEGNHFFKFFLAVVFEELLARWIFLGLLPRIPFLSGTIAFYFLFLIGNGIWAVIHLSNYTETSERHVLRILPQFVAGIFFTYIYVKYGLLASILTHFASNAVIFATHKVQRTSLVDALIILYSLLCAGGSYWLMTKPLADVLPWFADNPVFKLEGWEFWDYVKISIFISTCFVSGFGILLYDQVNMESRKSEKHNGCLSLILGIPIVVGIAYGLYAVMGLATSSVPYRVLGVAILLTFLQRGASGSAVSRSFWVGLPDTYITICILQALGFWPAVAWIAIETLVSVPRIALAKIDD
jgi:hypothetical protein